jgi:hypothetical protein
MFSLCKLLPVVLIALIGLWNAFVMTGVVCVWDLLSQQGNIALGVCYLVVFWVLFGLFCFAAVRTCTKKAGNPPIATEQPPIPSEPVVVESPIGKEVGEIPQIRDYNCPFCGRMKPERCHHCSICKKCVLKMDHHCPWVNNCIGFGNYKFFFLLLFYTVLADAFVLGVVISRFIVGAGKSDANYSKAAQTMFLITIVLDGLIMISSSVLLGYHTWITLGGKTTLEATMFGAERAKSMLVMQGVREDLIPKNIYDLGPLENWKQVFGDCWWKWIIPLYTSKGDGMTFPRASFLNDSAV